MVINIIFIVLLQVNLMHLYIQYSIDSVPFSNTRREYNQEAIRFQKITFHSQTVIQSLIPVEDTSHFRLWGH